MALEPEISGGALGVIRSEWGLSSFRGGILGVSEEPGIHHACHMIFSGLGLTGFYNRSSIRIM